MYLPRYATANVVDAFISHKDIYTHVHDQGSRAIFQTNSHRKERSPTQQHVRCSALEGMAIGGDRSHTTQVSDLSVSVSVSAWHAAFTWLSLPTNSSFSVSIEQSLLRRRINNTAFSLSRSVVAVTVLMRLSAVGFSSTWIMC